MIRRFTVMLGVALSAAPLQAQEPSAPGRPAPAPARSELNIPPKGFVALFNGRDFSGWRVRPVDREVWSIENGVLKGSGRGHSDLFTVKEYCDFVLVLDYKMTEPSDSGIYFRRLDPKWAPSASGSSSTSTPVAAAGRGIC